MTKSARNFIRRKTLDHTEFADKDRLEEFKLRTLKSHDRPVNVAVPVRAPDTVKDRALTEEEK